MNYYTKSVEWRNIVFPAVQNGVIHFALEPFFELLNMTDDKTRRNFKDWIRSGGRSYLKQGRKNYYTVESIRLALSNKLDVIEKRYPESFDAVMDFCSHGCNQLNVAADITESGEQIFDIKEIEIKAKSTDVESPIVIELKKELQEVKEGRSNLFDQLENVNKLYNDQTIKFNDLKNELEELTGSYEQENEQHSHDLRRLNEKISEHERAAELQRTESKFEKFIRNRLMSENSYLVATVILIGCLLPFSISAFMRYASFAHETATFIEYAKYALSVIMAIGLCFAWDYSILIFALKNTQIEIFGRNFKVADVGTAFQIVFISTHFDFIQLATGSDFTQKMVVVGCIIFYTAFLVNQLSKLSKTK